MKNLLTLPILIAALWTAFKSTIDATIKSAFFSAQFAAG